jgi:hypothetical protein
LLPPENSPATPWQVEAVHQIFERMPRELRPEFRPRAFEEADRAAVDRADVDWFDDHLRMIHASSSAKIAARNPLARNWRVAARLVAKCLFQW